MHSMRKIDDRRRNFLRSAGGSLIAIGAASGLGLSSRQAFSDNHQRVTQTRETQAAKTPAQALQRLKDGNARFVDGKLLKSNYREQMKATSGGQFPFAAIVGCIDSRASNELIFDQGIGDIFSTRVAGNFIDDEVLGGLEFACAISGALQIVVIGHTECGAIKGACDDVVFGNLTQTLSYIKPAVADVTGFDENRTSSNAQFVQAVADKNVALGIDRIRRRSPVLKALIDEGRLGLAGAMYDVHSGRVTFMS